ncbi:CHAT domain-containing protein [Novosphingobium olei]|uniref:CHAT domain-containing protein n=1 Tax=Novosphingobium olei TaxID=2728851 RepID=A0A7Y0BSB1_9SPHN|nr:CHAT domain-containing protein [Novosphingobium olei]
MRPSKPRLAFLFFALGTAACISTPAYATGPAEICRAGQYGGTISDFDLKSAVSSAQLLGAQATSDQVLASLEITTPHPGQMTSQARAEYCGLAGKAVRTAKVGSPQVAQGYLLTSLRLAEADGQAALSSQAAFQLSLNTMEGGSGRAVRGIQRGLSRSAISPSEPELTMALGSNSADETGNPCGNVLSGRRMASARLMSAMLECAAARALKARDYELAALSKLKLARFAQSLEVVSLDSELLRSQAGRSASEGLEIIEHASESRSKVELADRLVEVLVKTGRVGEYHSAILAAERLAQSCQSENLKADCEALRGRLALAKGDLRGAAGLAQQAIFYESQKPFASRLSDWLLLLADADSKNSKAHLLAAYRALGDIRPFLPAIDPLVEESNFSLRMKPVFERLVANQLQSDSLGDTQISEVQQTIEAYRQAEVQDLLGSECVPARLPLSPNELRPSEIILYPVVLDHSVELLVASGNGISSGYRRIASVKIERRLLSEYVRSFIDNTTLASASVSEEVRNKASGKLYQLLIQPIEGELSEKSTLIIIPDGLLRALPFAALVASDGSFLVQKTQLVIAPALAYSQPGLDRTGPKDAVLAASLQKEVSTPFGVFPRLEGVAVEAESVAQIGGRESRLLRDFTKEDLLTALSKYNLDVLHLATHASFNGGAERSFILTESGVLSLPELRQMMLSNRQRGGEIDLLVLSACETAVGDDQSTMGLAGAAVQSGARSALASLWQVSDVGTTELMQNFYREFRSGNSKAGALRRAQLALLQRGGDNADPGIWAAFELLGGWR